MSPRRDLATWSQKLTGGKPEMLVFFAALCFISLGNGLSDTVYNNYFKEVYNVGAEMRGFIETPRELPGMLCAAFIVFLSGMGDYRTAVVAQGLALLGLVVLGLLTPPFALMLVFLFVNSAGMHLFMPLQDAIGMDLAEPDRVGRRMGQYASVRQAVAFVAALLVFFGFRGGWFSFLSPIVWPFLIAAMAFAVALFLLILLVRVKKPPMGPKKRFTLLFRKQYRYYFALTILHGVQKQIAIVYGSWVVIELLQKSTDIMALLFIVSSAAGAVFMNYLGKWMDRFGIKKMMYLDAITFIVVYVLYGIVVWMITKSVLPIAGFGAGAVYVLFVMDRLSMQIGVVKSLYLRNIALDPTDITATISTGISLDHGVTIVASALCGIIWATWGPQWVFFVAAFFSLGNLFIAWKINPDKERALAEAVRAGIAQE